MIVDSIPYVRMTMTDHGTGISSNLMDSIMNPFFTTKPADKGTGLGLSISHGIISDHNGKISLESVEGEYSKVVIDLPVSQIN